MIRSASIIFNVIPVDFMTSWNLREYSKSATWLIKNPSNTFPLNTLIRLRLLTLAIDINSITTPTEIRNTFNKPNRFLSDSVVNKILDISFSWYRVELARNDHESLCMTNHPFNQRY